MKEKPLGHALIQTVVAVAVLLGVLVCVFPHYIPSLSWGVNYAVHLMLFYLLAGVAVLFFRQPRLTFVFFGGCAFLCIFLKYSVKSNGLPRLQRLPSKIQPLQPAKAPPTEFKIAHFNLTNCDSISQLIGVIKERKVDLISIHEVTPDWANLLKDSLSDIFPYHHTMVDIGIFGMSIFSHHNFEEIDTFHYKEIPNIRGCVKKNGEDLCFMSVQTEPALNAFSLGRLKEHLDVVGAAVQSTESPVVVWGDFNSVSWSGEIQSFLDDTRLMESRTGFMPYPFVNTSSMFKVPLDHIFYSEALQCNGFENIASKSGKHIGITGTYSPKPLEYHAKKTAQ